MGLSNWPMASQHMLLPGKWLCVPVLCRLTSSEGFQEHILNLGDVLRPLTADVVNYLIGGNGDCREDETSPTLSSRVVFISCKQGPQVFSPYLSQSVTFPFCTPSIKAAFISIRSYLSLFCELVLLCASLCCSHP